MHYVLNALIYLYLHTQKVMILMRWL